MRLHKIIKWWWFQHRHQYKWKLDKLLHFKKCSCGHPLWCHQCYEHGTCIHGVCLADTFLDEVCCCDGFNSMWNEQYPPSKPELRKQEAS